MRAILVDLDKTLIHDKGIEPILVSFITEKCKCPPILAKNLLQDFYLVQSQNSTYYHSFAKIGLWKNLFQKYNIEYSPEFLYTISSEFWKVVANNIHLYDDVLETLQQIKVEFSFEKIAIVSGGDFYSRFMQIKSTGLSEYIDILVTSEDTGLSKHKEDLYLKAAEELRFNIYDCLVVGDDEVADIILPQKDGFKTIKVGGGKENTSADFYIDQFNEILNLKIL